MAVPKSERRQSDVEYVVLLQKIEQYFLDYNMSDQRIPGLSDKLVDLSMDAYNKATMYFEMCLGRIVGTDAQKKKYCKETYYAARLIASQINILMAYRIEQKKPTAGLQQKTQELLKVCNMMRDQLSKLDKAGSGSPAVPENQAPPANKMKGEK